MAKNILPHCPPVGQAPPSRADLLAQLEATNARIAAKLAELEAGRQAIAAIEAPPIFVDRIIAKFGGRR